MRTLYKSRAWAWKASIKLKWHTVRKDGYGRYHVEPMTQDEKERTIRGISFDECIQRTYLAAIQAELSRPSVLWGPLNIPMRFR